VGDQSALSFRSRPPRPEEKQVLNLNCYTPLKAHDLSVRTRVLRGLYDTILAMPNGSSSLISNSVTGIVDAFGPLHSLGADNAQRKRPDPPESVRLYVLDCGKISGVTSREFGFRDGELESEMFTPCFLVEHPRGTLMWDTGEIPDSALNSDGSPTTQRSFTVTRPLLPQLAAIGYTPADITYLALSHYHNDHVANANSFTSSTWLVQRAEREAMFAPKADTKRNGPIVPNKALFSALEKSETIVLNNEDHDVFGDGKVVIKFSPGHTPGHQSLFLRLDKTGPVVISGDLYHYPEEMNRAAAFVNHADNDETTRSRSAIEDFVRNEGAEIWIQHDASHGAKLRKAPEFYD
jgi:N-acyl homoserine lactone hydrolase